MSSRDIFVTGSPAPAIAALSLLWVALWVAIDWQERQPLPSFTFDGFPVVGWYGLGVIALAAVLRRCSPAWPSHTASRTPTLGAALVLTLGLVPVPLLLITVMADWLEALGYEIACAVAGLYAMLYLSRGLHSLTGKPQRFAAGVGVLFIIGFIAASDRTNAIPDVWNPREDIATTSEPDPALEEAALFEQAGRIDEELDAVKRDASPRPEGFFVGFAGVGDQKVFAQEIGLASRVIGERYHTLEHQLSLVNDERDLDQAPLASVSGLQYALRGMAEHMQLDRDVLFLAISSHGSSDPAIAVSNFQLPFTDMTPQDLAQALEDSGIQWRVILVSACYAGGFIEPLQNPRTIVIAAAAPDRTSFGCSSDSDLTYFGEAFYRDALPDAKTLRDAFETAKAAIAVREHAEGETPSNPQAFFGAEIEAHLATMRSAEKQLPADRL